MEIPIPHHQSTRIDVGLSRAREELAGARHCLRNRPVIVLLTDGEANPVGPPAAVREAEAAKAAGVTIFTIRMDLAAENGSSS